MNLSITEGAVYMDKFEVFISFKNHDDYGNPTEESHIAEELYKTLHSRNIPVFYSNISLLELGESVYKRSIDSALDTSYVLILVSTSLDHIESRWIKYEWEGFHNDILNGIKKDGEIIAYTKGILPSALPRALRSYQNCQVESMSPDMISSFIENILKKIHASSPVPSSDAKPSDTSSLMQASRQRSIYSSTYRNEFSRLRIQARNSIQSDKAALDYIGQSDFPYDEWNILDVGCAYGFVAEDRFGSDERAACILGLDNNALAIEKAREIHTNPKMLFEVLDVEDEDFEEELASLLKKHGISDIHIIFSALTLHHLKNPKKVLRKLRKFLAKDGVIILRGSDDGSKLAYPNSNLMYQIIQKSLSAHGVSDRQNGRKLYAQLFDSGYHDIRIFSSMKDLSSIDYDDRDALFQESFAYRIDYFRKAYDQDPLDFQAKNDYEWMKEALDLFEQQFYEQNFWYCEYDYVGVARK